jgi:D-glucosaminate-6-phosphate ammonia-lyase
MSIYRRLGVTPIINARGHATLAGGSLMDPAVLDAYREAAAEFVRIDDLEVAASSIIARLTGAEAGYVTSGAAAAITLATAACIARFDVDLMDALPDAGDHPCSVLIERVHRNPYDRLVRAAGARLIEVGDATGTTARQVRDAIGPHVVAAYYQAQLETVGLPFEEFLAAAHDGGLPVIVDASMNLPPATNLRRYTEAGADLVAFSGGKAIRGPQSSGFLAGRADLVRSVGLQHQDMDVLAETWSERDLIDRAIVRRPPGHGIGRAMKVGKEDIVALLVALERYVGRDHAAEASRFADLAGRIAEGIGRIDGLHTGVEPSDESGRPIPLVRIAVDEAVVDCSAFDLVRALWVHDPPVLVSDHEAHVGIIRINPEALRTTDLEPLLRAFATSVRTAGAAAALRR